MVPNTPTLSLRSQLGTSKKATLAVRLRINSKSNPVVREIQTRYGREWARCHFIGPIPPMLDIALYDKLQAIAAHEQPFKLELGQLFRCKRRIDKTDTDKIHSVYFELKSATYEKIQERLRTQFGHSIMDYMTRLGWKGSKSYIWPRPRISVLTKLTDEYAAQVMTDLQRMCKDGAGSIIADGFILDQRDMKTRDHLGQKTYSELAEIPFTGIN